MKLLLINKSDNTGGAAIVTRRLLEAFRANGDDARMLVVENLVESPYIKRLANGWRMKLPFIAERLKIFLKNGFNRKTLFKIDTASDGIDISNHPWVREADVICLNWVNQGLLSVKDIEKLIDKGKKILWTMHDMWCFTAVCHHAGHCKGYIDRECKSCPLYGDHAYPIYKKKQKLYASGAITFIAVSNWLADKASESLLLKDQDVRVIPNPFPIKGSVDRVQKNRRNDDKKSTSDDHRQSHTINILFGAARLDDPIKGLPVLIKALKIISEKYPEIAKKLRLTTFGGVKDPSTLDDIPVEVEHKGIVHGEDKVRELYEASDILVSTSSYETLPGTLVEAQAYGAIPVSFNQGGQPDIVKEGETGFLASWSEDSNQAARNIVSALLKAIGVVNNPTRYEEFRKAMIVSVKKRFSPESVVKSYEALIR